MLRAAIVFFMLALVAVVFGVNGIAGVSLEIGKMFLFVFLILGAISMIAALVSGRKPPAVH